MFPSFNFTQTPAQRIALIQKVNTFSNISAEQLESEISKSFANCGMELRVAEIGRGIQQDLVGVYDAYEKDFSAMHNSGRDAVGPTLVTGPGFSYGLLADLLEAHAVCCRHGIGFEDFADEFKGSHLTCIQEILALGAWPHAINPQHGFRTSAGKKNVDWKFSTKGKTVLLEVKFRRTDWRRNHPETEIYKIENLFQEISEKFPDRASDVWRIAHIHIIQPVDNDVASACEKFLASSHLDALVVEPLNQIGAPIILGSIAEQVRAHLRGGSRCYMRPLSIPIVFRRPSTR
jgi:hypothetical protein